MAWRWSAAATRPTPRARAPGRPGAGWLHDPDDGRHALRVDAARGACGPLTGGPEEALAIPAGPDAMQQAFERIDEQQAKAGGGGLERPRILCTSCSEHARSG